MEGFGVWLINVMNVTLGAVTLLAVLAAVGGTIHEILSRHKKRATLMAEMETDIRTLFHTGSSLAHGRPLR